VSFEQDPFRFSIGQLQAKVMENILDSVLDARVNYSMDMVTELDVNIFDTGFQFGANNYFRVTNDVYYTTKSISSFEQVEDGIAIRYKTLAMEIAEVRVSQSQGFNPIWNIKCRTKAVQQMKRDKNPGALSGSSGTAFVRAAAKKYGLEFVGEETSKSVKINKASGKNAADSLWTVLGNLANEAKFKLFEADGTLYFASMKWLLHKWGTKSIVVPVETTNTKTGQKEKKAVVRKFIPLVPGKVGKDFELMSLPEMHKSDNDPLESDGSAVIARMNGTSLRPGMTVFVDGIPSFVGYYLIQSVDYEELSPNPVSISFMTPERDPKDVVPLPVGPRFAATGDMIGPGIWLPFLEEGITVQETTAPFPPYKAVT
jgi:hypothetical protein